MARRITINRNGFSGSGHFLMIKEDMDWKGFLAAAAGKVYLPKVIGVYGTGGERYTELDEIMTGDNIFVANGDPFIPEMDRIHVDVSNSIFWRQGDKQNYKSIDLSEGAMTVQNLLRQIRASNKRFASADLQLCQEEEKSMSFLEEDEFVKIGTDGNPNFRLIAQNVAAEEPPAPSVTIPRVPEESSPRVVPRRSESTDSRSEASSDGGAVAMLSRPRSSTPMGQLKGSTGNMSDGGSALYLTSAAKSESDAGVKDNFSAVARSEISELAKRGGAIDGKTSGDLEQLKKTIKYLDSFKRSPAELVRGRKALQKLLLDPYAIEYMRSFVQCQDCTEMIDFLRINMIFKEEVSIEIATSIFDTFVLHDGARSLNLTSKTVQNVDEQLTSRDVNEGLFKPVETEVEEYMVKTVLPSFFESPTWQYLVDSKNVVSERDVVFCNTELHVAANALRGTRIQELVQQRHPLNTRNRHLNTPLHIILSKIQDTKEKLLVPFVQFMIANGADVNMQNVAGDTPFHIAARANCSILIPILLKSKRPANLRLANNAGELAVDLAKKGKGREALRAVLLHDVGKQDDRGTDDFIVFGVEWEVHPQIDAEHKEIIAVINQLARLIDEQEDYFDVLNDLYRVACTHNGHEEQFMRQGNYPQIKKHSAYHRKLEKNIAKMISNYSNRNENSDRQILTILSGWFKDHIFENDKLLTPFLAGIELKF